MLKDNPHNLSPDEITEWENIRCSKFKAPINERAWKRNNRVLFELLNKGLRLSEVMDRMLSAEWRGVDKKQSSAKEMQAKEVFQI